MNLNFCLKNKDGWTLLNGQLSLTRLLANGLFARLRKTFAASSGACWEKSPWQLRRVKCLGSGAAQKGSFFRNIPNSRNRTRGSRHTWCVGGSIKATPGRDCQARDVSANTESQACSVARVRSHDKTHFHTAKREARYHRHLPVYCQFA